MKTDSHLLDNILGSRFWALLAKSRRYFSTACEILLLPPPSFDPVWLGSESDFENLKVGITATATAAPRVSSLSIRTDRCFAVSQYYADAQAMAAVGSTGKLIVGVTIPPEFAEDIARRRTVKCRYSTTLSMPTAALPPAT